MQNEWFITNKPFVLFIKVNANNVNKYICQSTCTC